MIEVHNTHPYEAIFQFIFRWMECVVRGDYVGADGLVDLFESDSRIGDYFNFEDDAGPIKAIDPVDGEWWQISFNRTNDERRAIFVEAYVPLERDYRPMNACFVFTPSATGFSVEFQYCKPS